MEKLTFCICTRNRPEGITRLIKSIFCLDLTNLNLQIEILIVENDLIPKSKSLINDLNFQSPFKINYFLESRQGISVARNRTIKESYGNDYCIFIDDDQEVKKDLLIELFRCQREFGADGVYGNNPPLFEENKVPEYVKIFFTRKAEKYGTRLTNAYTNCLMLKYSLFDLYNLKFDERLNFLGGEDIYLTELMIEQGAKIISNPNAIAYEIIPKERTTINYIIKRSFRDAVTDIIVCKFHGMKFNFLMQIFLKAILKVPYSIIIIFIYFFLNKKNKLEGIVKLMHALGTIYALLGYTFSFYK